MARLFALRRGPEVNAGLSPEFPGGAAGGGSGARQPTRQPPQDAQHGDPRHGAGHERGGERDRDDARIALPADREGAEQGLDLVAGGAAAPGREQEPAERDQEKGEAAAGEPAFEPEAEEAALELAGDEGVVGADEMQHVDDLAVAGNRPSRREGDGKPGRN